MRRGLLRTFISTVLPAVLLAGPALASVVVVAQEPPPPTTGPDGEPSPLGPTALQTPADAVPAPRIDVPSFVLMDVRGQVLLAKAPDQPRPVASLTKLMTAFEILSDTNGRPAGPGAGLVTVSPAAASQPGSSAELVAGEELPVVDLFYAMLVASANDAAFALAERYGNRSVQRFVENMNRTAADLGMAHSSFESPDGLDDDGRSTALDIARLVREIFTGSSSVSNQGFIPDALARRRWDLPPGPGSDERRIFVNRNALLWLYPGTLGGKTGFTAGAGYCIVEIAERDGRVMFVVVLGDDDEPFSEAVALLEHGFEGWEEKRLVTEGEELDEVVVDGLVHPVVAARTVSRQVPVDEQVGLEFVIRDETTGLAPGDRVGKIVFRLRGETIAVVPLVVGERETTPPPRGRQREDARWAVIVASALLFGFLVLLVLLAMLRRTLSRRRS